MKASEFFDEEAWRQNCYLPHNSIYRVFLSHAPDMAAMVADQAEMMKARFSRLEGHPFYDRDSWGKYLAWTDEAERTLLDQIEFSLANGDLWPPDGTNIMAIGHRICRMQVLPMGEWRPLPVKVRRSVYHGGGHIVDIVPEDESIDTGIDFAKPDPREVRSKVVRQLPPGGPKGRT